MRRCFLVLCALVLASLPVFGQHVETGSSVGFQWDAVTNWGTSGASHYQLWIAVSSAGTFQPIGGQVLAGTETVLINRDQCSSDPGVCATSGATRYYVVTAENAAGLVSGYSNEISVLFEHTGPDTPSNLRVSSGP